MHKVKTLIVGQAPRRNVKNPKPWSGGQAAKRLWKWFECSSYKELKQYGDCYYAIPWLEGIAKKGDKVPTDKSTLSYLKHRLVKKINSKYRKVFLIGRFAQTLIPDTELPVGVEFCKIPHPSGCNVSANHKDDEIKKMIWNFLNN